jgi:hypothetical protein
MKENTPVLSLVTRHYVAMKPFFADVGFDVPAVDSGWQITPAFNQGRGCAIIAGSLLICLEEAKHSEPSGPLYLEIAEVSEDRLPVLRTQHSLKSSGRRFYGSGCYQIVPPDGGCVVFGTQPSANRQ